MLLHKTVRELAAGEIVEVIATDPSTTRDIPKFCHFLQHQLLAQEEREQRYLYYIRQAGCERVTGQWWGSAILLNI